MIRTTGKFVHAIIHVPNRDQLDEFVIMPNPVHGIIVLNAHVGVGLALPGTTYEMKPKRKGAASGALRWVTLCGHSNPLQP